MLLRCFLECIDRVDAKFFGTMPPGIAIGNKMNRKTAPYPIMSYSALSYQ